MSGGGGGVESERGASERRRNSRIQRQKSRKSQAKSVRQHFGRLHLQMKNLPMKSLRKRKDEHPRERSDKRRRACKCPGASNGKAIARALRSKSFRWNCGSWRLRCSTFLDCHRLRYSLSCLLSYTSHVGPLWDLCSFRINLRSLGPTVVNSAELGL